MEKDLSQQVEHMQVQNGRDQVFGGVSFSCRHAKPVANALWKPHNSVKVKLGNKVMISSKSETELKLACRHHDNFVISSRTGKKY